MIEIVSKLREVRLGKRVSIAQISRDTGIARSSITDYEGGRERPAIVNAYILAHYLGVRVDEIFVPVVDHRIAS